MEKKLNNEVVNNGNKELLMATFLLRLSGADKIPAEVKDQVLEDLGLSTSDLLAFTSHKLNEEEAEKKLNFIKGLMVSQLLPSQLMSLHSFIREIVTGAMENMAKNPEQKEEVSMEALLKNMYDIL